MISTAVIVKDLTNNGETTPTMERHLYFSRIAFLWHSPKKYSPLHKGVANSYIKPATPLFTVSFGIILRCAFGDTTPANCADATSQPNRRGERGFFHSSQS